MFIINLISKEVPVATVWSTRIAICKSAQTFINKCTDVSSLTISEETLNILWQSLKICTADRGYESVRTAAAKTVADFVRWVDGRPESWGILGAQIRTELDEIIAAETSGAIVAEYTACQ